jgi:hypothetical protein
MNFGPAKWGNFRCAAKILPHAVATRSFSADRGDRRRGGGSMQVAKELLNSRQVVENGCLETMEVTMPILLWLIGIPIPIIILLMLLHH